MNETRSDGTLSTEGIVAVSFGALVLFWFLLGVAYFLYNERRELHRSVEEGLRKTEAGKARFAARALRYGRSSTESVSVWGEGPL